MKVTWNHGAFERMRRLPAVRADLGRRAAQVASSTGPGYAASTSQGRTRARAGVVTADYGAIVDNSRNNTLVRSLDAGRD